MIKKVIILFTIVMFIFIPGCREIDKLLSDENPHEDYRKKLENAGLLETAIGKKWIQSAEDAFNKYVIINSPYKEEGYFFEDEVNAYSYKFDARRGEKISIKIKYDSDKLMFAELFSVKKPDDELAFADTSRSINYLVEENDSLLLRVQPELLAGGSYELLIEKNPSIAFPVNGKDSRAIGSGFGDSRDGGKRKHKGVDIFAPKGTPVLAAAGGVVYRTGITNLGGKIIWLSNLDKSYYYAHLDSQIVTPPAVVSAGDTLGLVGNTGNAKYTPHHLHFGIYTRGEGAIDPEPFIKNVYPEPEQVNVNKNLIGNWGRIRSAVSNFYLAKGKSKSLTLKKATPFKITGGSGNWFKIMLPDYSTGFIHNSLVDVAYKPLKKFNFSLGSFIVKFPYKPDNVIASLDKNSSFPVYGEFNNYNLINFKNRFVWIIETAN